VHRDPLNHAPFSIQLCINDIGTHDDLNINYLTVVGSGIDIATTTSSSVYRNMVNSVESHFKMRNTVEDWSVLLFYLIAIGKYHLCPYQQTIITGHYLI